MNTSNESSSRHLSPRQLKGLCKIGDILVCGDEHLVSFSKSGQVSHIDRILDYISPQDLNDFKLLMWVFSWLPQSLLLVLWTVIDSSNQWPRWFGSTARLLRIGVKGMVLSLYYFEGKSLEVMGYQVSVYTADLKE